MVIGITGGICCGKTTVLSVLKKLNFKVFNVDDISHNLLNEDEVKEEIKEKISKDVFCDNKIDRKKLASVLQRTGSDGRKAQGRYILNL